MTSDTGRGDARPRLRASVRLGRRIFVVGLVVYTLLLCGAAVRSWWPTIFWPAPSRAAATAYRDVRCTDGLVELRGRLDAELGRSTLGRAPKEPGFWEDWDDRHAALGEACDRSGGGSADAHAALYRLRHRYRAFITRFERDVAPIAHETDERIERVIDSSPRAHAALSPDGAAAAPTTGNTSPRVSQRTRALLHSSSAAAGVTNGHHL